MHSKDHRLHVSIGQYSDRGRKPCNQDFHGALMPDEPQRSLKGVAVAMADGISSSSVSQIASATAVKTFLDDYFCTSEAWTVKNATFRILAAINSWLDAQTRQSPHRFYRDKGYVCTFSAVVIKETTAHVVHVGDTRVYRVHERALEQLTHDHRLVVSQQENHLSRALGAAAHVEPDYQALRLRAGDTFILMTDGVYEHVDAEQVLEHLDACGHDLDAAAKHIGQRAFENGSPDNLSIQILRVDGLPDRKTRSLQRHIDRLPLPPLLQAGADFDGYRIVREIHASARSHAYLALDRETGSAVVLKTPSTDLGGDPDYLERFFMEEWIARRISSAHVLQAAPQTRTRNFLYTASEYIEGQTLAQWLRDHPRPDLETVRGIIEQVAKGLRAFHRMEMLHQDLKPDNVMIDQAGTVRIIDFGSTRVAGLMEMHPAADSGDLLGTALYTAPEYLLGQGGTARSDLYSLGVLTYFMLSGRFPYGAQIARARTANAQRRLRYRSVIDEDRGIPAWVDWSLQKAVQPDPHKRYEHLSEFLYDLRNPSQSFLSQTRPPLLERNPLVFWQGVAFVQILVIIALLVS